MTSRAKKPWLHQEYTVQPGNKSLQLLHVRLKIMSLIVTMKIKKGRILTGRKAHPSQAGQVERCWYLCRDGQLVAPEEKFSFKVFLQTFQFSLLSDPEIRKFLTHSYFSRKREIMHIFTKQTKVLVARKFPQDPQLFGESKKSNKKISPLCEAENLCVNPSLTR